MKKVASTRFPSEDQIIDDLLPVLKYVGTSKPFTSLEKEFFAYFPSHEFKTEEEFRSFNNVVIEKALNQQTILEGILMIGHYFCLCNSYFNRSEAEIKQFTQTPPSRIFVTLRAELLEKRIEFTRARKFLIFLSNNALLIPQKDLPKLKKSKSEKLYVYFLQELFSEMENCLIYEKRVVQGPFAYILKKIKRRFPDVQEPPLILFDDPKNFAEFCLQKIKHRKLSTFCCCLDFWDFSSYIKKIAIYDFIHIVLYILYCRINDVHLHQILDKLSAKGDDIFNWNLDSFKEFWTLRYEKFVCSFEFAPLSVARTQRTRQSRH
jgi:hypothetical protein